MIVLNKQEESFITDGSTGVRIQVTDKDEYPFVDAFGSYSPPGIWSQVAIRKASLF